MLRLKSIIISISIFSIHLKYHERYFELRFVDVFFLQFSTQVTLTSPFSYLPAMVSVSAPFYQINFNQSIFCIKNDSIVAILSLQTRPFQRWNNVYKTLCVYWEIYQTLKKIYKWAYDNSVRAVDTGIPGNKLSYFFLNLKRY